MRVHWYRRRERQYEAKQQDALARWPGGARHPVCISQSVARVASELESGLECAGWGMTEGRRANPP